MNKLKFYVLLFDNGIKIGITSNINRRIHEEYDKPWSRIPIKAVVFKHLSFPKSVETETKRYLRSYSFKSPEFFVGVKFGRVLRIVHSIARDIEWERGSALGRWEPKRAEFEDLDLAKILTNGMVS